MKSLVLVVCHKRKGLAFSFSPFLVRLSGPALLISFNSITFSYFCLIMNWGLLFASKLPYPLQLGLPSAFAIWLLICLASTSPACNGGSHFGCCLRELKCGIKFCYLGSLVLGLKPIVSLSSLLFDVNKGLVLMPLTWLFLMLGAIRPQLIKYPRGYRWAWGSILWPCPLWLVDGKDFGKRL